MCSVIQQQTFLELITPLYIIPKRHFSARKMFSEYFRRGLSHAESQRNGDDTSGAVPPSASRYI